MVNDGIKNYETEAVSTVTITTGKEADRHVSMHTSKHRHTDTHQQFDDRVPKMVKGFTYSYTSNQSAEDRLE
jgi:fatty-acid desaturase